MGGASRLLASFFVLLIAFAAAAAQNSGKDTPPIQDNSFLVEEAYNQEPGVVQHINTFTRDFSSHSWMYSFTQEFPAHGLKHQLSYTVSALNNTDFRNMGAGAGDLLLNYRYQLAGDGKARFAMAPRISVIAPTGDPQAGRGYGGWGVQFMAPASVVISRHLVTHWNAGATIVPRAQDAHGDRARNVGYNLGQSFVWLAKARLNFLLETVWAGSETVVGPGRTQRSHDMMISPGVRWAYNLSHDLQIVPGIGVPVGVGPSAGEKGILLYLSFELPYWKPAKK